MYITGLLIGIFSFVIIGVFHPIVIRCEYHFTWKIWPVFLAAGLVCLLTSLFVENTLLSSLLSVLGFTCLWSIGELKEQKVRVEKGWFPANPKRADREAQAGRQRRLTASGFSEAATLATLLLLPAVQAGLFFFHAAQKGGNNWLPALSANEIIILLSCVQSTRCSKPGDLHGA